MNRKFVISLILITLIFQVSNSQTIDFNDLVSDQRINGFTTKAIYQGQDSNIVGARFIHNQSGFVLDLIRIQSVPQNFLWVNTPPPSDQGEPHTCEHLLLGKGTKGKYASSLEGMRLGRSSAFTMQLFTCYHYHTSGSNDVFFELFEENLDALIHPTFTDEDIRREVRNFGYKANSETNEIVLEEKGTVYNEMVSGFERPWSNIGRALNHMIFGTNHPLALSSGGYPPAIRTMTPEDMWTFIDNHYHLNNMGTIMTIPDAISIEECLNKLNKIFKNIEPDIKFNNNVALSYLDMPPPVEAEYGDIKLVEFGHRNINEPGLLLFGWPANREFDWDDSYLLDYFITNIASGESSNLFKTFINSETKSFDIGATSVFGWVSDDAGQTISVGFSNVNQEFLEPTMIDSIRFTILSEIKRISELDDNSEELLSFNKRIKNSLKAQKRSILNFLNRPPGFGIRGTYSSWMSHLQILNRHDSFKKKITMDDRLDYAFSRLESGENIWKKLVSKWKLLDPIPYAAAGKPNPDLLALKESERTKRIDDFIASLKQKYSVATNSEAITLYKEEYDSNTAIIEKATEQVKMPGFAKNPPLVIDQSINYTVEKLPGEADFVFSKFDNISLAYAGFAFDMHVVPESLLFYAALLPTIINEAGLIKDGQPVSNTDLQEIVREQFTGLNVYFDVNSRTDRNELIFTASGSNLKEAEIALDWLKAMIYNPDLRKENLPRLKDALDISFSNFRNRMRGSEEGWVQDPSTAYIMQNNPLYLTTSSFLTKSHSIYRSRWQLKEASSPEILNEFNDFMDALEKMGAVTDNNYREKLLLLNSSEFDEASITETDIVNIYNRYDNLPDEAKNLANDALTDLNLITNDIPENSAAQDWTYLCNQIKNDLALAPDDALNKIKETLDIILHKDNYRSFMVASSQNKESLKPAVINIVDDLSDQPSVKQAYAHKNNITQRYQARSNNTEAIIHKGLINPNTRSGVVINSSHSVSFADSDDPDKIMKFLSARLYGGWGAHSMFMKTWGAGLAYSNGLRHNEYSGMMQYYAERCPDVAQTVKFVVDELKKATYDTLLADYAIAQAFYISRDANSYESRGESMAADLADGLTPEVVSRFRQKVLDLRKEDGFYKKIQNQMETTYGEILPGYGPNTNEVAGASHFIIGPDSQFESYQKYLNATEGNITLHKLYPRDFWLIQD